VVFAKVRLPLLEAVSIFILLKQTAILPPRRRCLEDAATEGTPQGRCREVGDRNEQNCAAVMGRKSDRRQELRSNGASAGAHGLISQNSCQVKVKVKVIDPVTKSFPSYVQLISYFSHSGNRLEFLKAGDEHPIECR
jgi:hypothetical protein